AVETFTRSKMSPEARSQLKLVIDDLFDESLVGGISRGRSQNGRKLTSAEVTKLIDEGPFTARRALSLGLVDFNLYPRDFEKVIEKEVKGPDFKIVRNYGAEKSKELDFSNPFAIFKALMGPSKTAFRPGKDRIALIYAVGPIVTGKGGASLFGADVVGSATMV